MADFYGQGVPDIVGFGEASIVIAKNKGDGTFDDPHDIPGLNQFTYVNGWHVDKHVRTFANVAGAADFVGFGDDGVYVAINNGNGTVKAAAEPVLKAFGYDQGWRAGRDIRIIADITGNGVGDIVGFGEHGVYVSRNRGRGAFDPAKLVMRDFGYLQGWRVEKHPRFVVDVTGNGCADIVGFGEKATYVALNDRHGNFAPAQKLSEEFSWNKGWDPSKSVRYVLPRVWGKVTESPRNV